MDQIPLKEIEKYFLPLAKQYLDPRDYRIFVFGSRASGTSTPTSDIDIGIQGAKPVPRHTLARLREELKETPILYKIDLVDMSAVSKNFRELALKNAKTLTL